jgi:glycosyltransferase involved in cell wall biosynthesis
MIDTARPPLVTVCIPSYMRPELLEAALRSVVAQDYPALEIVVGDDSPDDSAAPVVERVRSATAIPLRYWRNLPKLGQNANVNRLFHEARGSYLLLLHDDDLLAPGAIAALMSPILRDPRVRVVFGKQTAIDADGTILPRETHNINYDFGRVGESRAFANPLEACLMQRIPNDSYVIEAALAREVGYRPEEEIGVFVDTDFGIRVGLVLGPDQMWFVDAFVASYRRSSDSISVSPTSRRIDHPVAGAALYRLVTSLQLPPSSEYARQFLLRALGNQMLKGFALQGDRLTALRLFTSAAYGWRKRFSALGAYHLALIAFPGIDRLRRY